MSLEEVKQRDQNFFIQRRQKPQLFPSAVNIGGKIRDTTKIAKEPRATKRKTTDVETRLEVDFPSLGKKVINYKSGAFAGNLTLYSLLCENMSKSDMDNIIWEMQSLNTILRNLTRFASDLGISEAYERQSIFKEKINTAFSGLYHPKIPDPELSWAERKKETAEREKYVDDIEKIDTTQREYMEVKILARMRDEDFVDSQTRKVIIDSLLSIVDKKLASWLQTTKDKSAPTIPLFFLLSEGELVTKFKDAVTYMFSTDMTNNEYYYYLGIMKEHRRKWFADYAINAENRKDDELRTLIHALFNGNKIYRHIFGEDSSTSFDKTRRNIALESQKTAGIRGGIWYKVRRLSDEEITAVNADITKEKERREKMSPLLASLVKDRAKINATDVLIVNVVDGDSLKEPEEITDWQKLIKVGSTVELNTAEIDLLVAWFNLVAHKNGETLNNF
jgi:hypothetical protein